jgi:methylated-DNA-[protein]-cysteine S-methyltransferase
MVMLGSMTEIVLTILQQRDKYVAGVFTSKGLYATSLPRDSPDEAIEAVDGFNLREIRTSVHNEVLRMVFDLYNGVQRSDARDIILDFSGLTDKQVAVLQTTLRIPYGQTLTYGQVAERAGLPGAARFVGNVMAKNRFAPIIPCHRVVSTTGLGGYTGGLDIKKELLRKESAIAD